MPNAAPPTDLGLFRASVARFLAHSTASGVACPAFGAILPPGLCDAARAWQARIAAAGFAGLHWPVAVGGRGLGHEHTAIWFEECARSDVSPFLNLQGLVLAGEAILRSGTAAQQERFLPPTLTGEMLWCQLFSEPGAGSDLGSLRTAAVADGDRYVVDGQKVWTSNGELADSGILLARTDDSTSDHRGISCFLLDMRSAGVEVRPLRQMTGDVEFCEVFLDGVEVPIDARLGPPGSGWRIAIEMLQDERGSVGSAGSIGLERRLAQLMALGRGRPSDTDALMDVLARGRSLSATLQREGLGSASTAKLGLTELEFDSAVLAATMRGADATLAGEATDRLLAAPGMRIAGGTSEIQRTIIAERVLGLPRESREPRRA